MQKTIRWEPRGNDDKGNVSCYVAVEDRGFCNDVKLQDVEVATIVFVDGEKEWVVLGPQRLEYIYFRSVENIKSFIECYLNR